MRKEYYEAHKEEIKRKARERYKKNRDRILNQKNERYARERDEILVRRRKAWKENPEIKKNHDEYHCQLKNRCYEILGGKCVHCGESDYNLLSIDHINEDGAQERKTLTLVKLRSNIVNGANRENYQLLCFNCNLKKHINQYSVLEFGDKKQCYLCGEQKDTGEFCDNVSQDDGKSYKCRKCIRQGEIETKVQALRFIGSLKCAGCGTEDVDILTIDHIHDVGNNRQWLGRDLYRKITQQLISVQNMQILCLNCNIKKSNSEKSTYLKLRAYANESFFEFPPVHTKVRYDGDIVDFKFIDIQIKGGDSDSISFLTCHHYGGNGRPGSQYYNAFLNDELIAVVKFAPPVRQKVASSIGYESNEIFELDRFCIHPAYQKKNFASFLLSRVAKLAKQDYPDIKCLVSFADPRHGHDGTIYKAANWKFVRKTAYSYAYENGNGEEINKKTLYNWAKVRGMTEKEGVEQLCLKKIKLPRKLKFVYEL